MNWIIFEFMFKPTATAELHPLHGNMRERLPIILSIHLLLWQHHFKRPLAEKKTVTSPLCPSLQNNLFPISSALWATFSDVGGGWTNEDISRCRNKTFFFPTFFPSLQRNAPYLPPSFQITFFPLSPALLKIDFFIWYISSAILPKTQWTGAPTARNPIFQFTPKLLDDLHYESIKWLRFYFHKRKWECENVRICNVCSSLLSAALSAGKNTFKKFQFSHCWFDVRESGASLSYAL